MRSLVCLSLAALFLTGCSLSSPAPVIVSTGSTAVTEKASYAEDIKNASPTLRDTKEFSDCLQPSVNMCLTQVGNMLARAQKSDAVCKEITWTENQDACRYGVIMSQAIEKNDPSLCDTLNTVYKRECRATLIRSAAQEKKDIKLCDGLAELYATGTGDLEEENQSLQLDQCKMNILQSSETASADDCDALSTKSMQDICKNVIKNRIILPTPEPTPAPLPPTEVTSGSTQL